MTANGTLPYRLWQHPSFHHWNGYVGVPKEHSLYEKDYSFSFCGHTGCYEHRLESRLDVHGGITYSGFYEKDDKTYWWFGFDTGHVNDDPRYGGTTKSKEYVRTECLKLARQLQEWK